MGRGANLLLVLALGGCDRPAAIVVLCHNANCKAPRDRDLDDTLPALDASLALVTRDGEPVLDGIELDLSWSGDEARCVFAHDLDGVGWPAASEAADRVVGYVRETGPRAARGDRFHVLIELKRAVAPDGTRHDGSQRRDHAECALDVFEAVRDTALEVDQPIAVIFESFEPDLLRELTERPRWPGATRDGLVHVLLGASFSVPAPLGYSHTLDDFGGIELDVADVHPRFTSSADRRVYDGLGIEVAFWTESVDGELFDAMQSDPPAYVVASDAELVRAWLDD